MFCGLDFSEAIPALMTDRVLDLYTLSILLILITATLSVAMLAAWRANKTYAGFGWWTAGNLVAASGFIAIIFRGVLPDFVTITLSNLVSVVGLLAALHGVRLFLGRPGRVHLNVVMIALHLISSTYFTQLADSVVMRIVCLAMITGTIAAFSSWEFIAIPKHAKRFVHRFAAVIFGGFSFVLFMRGVATYAVPIDHIFVPSWIQSLSFLFFNLFAVLWTFTYMVLNSQRLQEELETTQVELERLATTDYLTGLSNTRAFFDRAALEINRSQRHEIPLSVVVFDIDHFKKVNDTFGHPGGDRMLKELAATCRAMTRQNDMLSRLGGEEFGLLLTHTDINGAVCVAESFRKAVEELIVEHEADRIFVTSSFGVTELREHDTVESFMARADRSLYEAKGLGRNCVVTESREPDTFPEGVNIIPPAHLPIHSDRHV
jgi:diguanylate cyclase (GGDEF)-like protein